jgi:S-adenosylmethionine/arginine decarboxylase-like enzyme
LTVDGFADPELLRDRDHLERTLRGLAAAAKMELLDLRLYEVPEDPSAAGKFPFEDSGGITGYAVLTTSHASFHGFPQTGEYRFDLYSCKDFDPGRVKQLLINHLCGSAVEARNWVR